MGVQRDKRYRDWDRNLQSVIDKYGSGNIERLAGHSLGGRGSLAQPEKTRAPASRTARNRFTALPPFTFTLVPEEKANNYN